MKKKISKETKEELKKNIPNEVKILFGKFYFFSVVYVIFFLILFPFLFRPRISLLSSILIMILLALFYVYIVIDVLRKERGFKSYLFSVFILLVVFAYSFSLIKFFVWLEKISIFSIIHGIII